MAYNQQYHPPQRPEWQQQQQQRWHQHTHHGDGVYHGGGAGGAAAARPARGGGGGGVAAAARPHAHIHRPALTQPPLTEGSGEGGGGVGRATLATTVASEAALHGYGIAELQPLEYEVIAASFSGPTGPAAALELWDRRLSWYAGSLGERWVLLRLREKCLLSYVRIWNGGSNSIEVSISMTGHRQRNFVPVRSAHKLALDRVQHVPTGHLPCRYVRLSCGVAGAANAGGGGSGRAGGGVKDTNSPCLHAIQLVGLPCSGLQRAMGPALEYLVSYSTEALLFGPSLAASQPPTADEHLVHLLAQPLPSPPLRLPRQLQACAGAF